MPAIITLPPAIVDQIKAAEDFYLEILPIGFFLRGNNAYLVLQYFSAGDPPHAYPPSIGVYKSIDSGATWTEQDAANNITDAFLTPQAVTFDGTKIYIAYFLNVAGFGNRSLIVRPFNTTTNLYETAGTPLVGGDANNVGGLQSPCYVLADGTFIIFTVPSSALGYLTYLSGVWSTFTDLGLPIASNADGVTLDSAFRGHVFYDRSTNQLKYVLVDASLVAGTPITLSNRYDGLRTSSLIWNNSIAVGWTETTQTVRVAIGTPLGAAAFTTYLIATAAGTDVISYAVLLLDPSGNLVVRYILSSNTFPYATMQIWQSTFDGVGAWGAPVLFYNFLANPPVNPGDLTQFLENGQATYLPNGASIHFVAVETQALDPSVDFGMVLLTPGTPTPTVITPQSQPPGRGFIHITPNRFDACLGREYRLFQDIDRYLYSCHKKPDCFNIPEREWGMDDAEDIPTGPPPGSIPLNKQGSIVLPAPAAGDVTIFEFRVPIGFDGILLGQFHGYSFVPGGPGSNFVQGSGDIVWRISVNISRYARDSGNMTVSLGSPRSESPIPGGIWLQSGDLVRYIVNVPNLSGTLAPGRGSILAGLHGYFWNRK